MKISLASIHGAALAGLATLLVGCGGGYGGGNGDTPATLTISINPMTINVGQSATITWNSNGSTCTASGAWTGAKAGSGNEAVSPGAAGTYTYSLRCRGGGYGESQQGSVTLTVNAVSVAGLWIGQACCIDANSFHVAGMTSEAGDYQFMLLDTHYVGQAGKMPIAYATSGSALAGTRQAAAPVFTMLEIAPRSAVRESVYVSGGAGQARNVDFSVPYDKSFERAIGVADLQGSYTTHLGTGYTLTMSFDSSGQVFGSDTNGCVLNGRASQRRPQLNYYDLVLDVRGCGNSNGGYEGNASLLGDDTGRLSELILSISNADAAIGWRLTR